VTGLVLALVQAMLVCTGAKDGVMRRVEVISGPERRRRWSKEQKRAIVAEAFAPGASVSAVARRVDVVPKQIYRWRRELCNAAAGFAEVVVSPSSYERAEAKGPCVEIEVGGDVRIRIPTTTSKALACAVIRAVVSR
jgi:transposase